MTLGEFFALLRRHIVFMIVLPVVLALVAVGICAFLPDQYTATTTMYVLSKNGTSAQNQNNADSSSTDLNNLSAGQMLANDVATIAKSSRVASDVAQQVGLSSLGNYHIDVQSSDTSRIITLTVTGSNPQQAASIANAYVQKTSSTTSSVMGVKAVNVVDEALVPASPSGPNRPLYVVVTFLVGLILAACIVVVADCMNTKVRRDEEAQEITGLPVVAHFPKINS